MRLLTMTAQVLLVVGGLNWLLVGLFQFDLIAALLGGQGTLLARFVYLLIGLSAVWFVSRLGTGFGTAPETPPPPPRG